MSKAASITGNISANLKISPEEAKKLIADSIDEAISEGYDVFYTGACEGVETWAAKMLIEKKKEHNIKLICVIPDGVFGFQWDDNWHKDYEFIKQNSDELVTAKRQQDRVKVDRIRNYYIADHIDRLYAICNGAKDPTKGLVLHMLRNNKEVKTFKA